jgi:DNA-binding NarL/FixJ family response regulator
VLDGGIYIPPAALRALPNDGPPDTAAPSAEAAAPLEAPASAPTNDISLTERQQAVLRLIVQGASNKVIARTLDLSASTVKGHVANLLRLYEAENRMELVHAAIRRGLPALEPKGSEPHHPS